jgi:restriction system protein
MSLALEAAHRVLTEANGPLHYQEIAKRAIADGHWQPNGKTPEATINAQLSVHIKKAGTEARFQRTGPGTYALAGNAAPTGANDGHPVERPPKRIPQRTTISFTDAAERVLAAAPQRRPMHYREIAAKALELGLVSTTGRTPEATMYSSILQEMQRYRKRGEEPRFHMHGKGVIGLAKWMPRGLPKTIEDHNRKVRADLRNTLHTMPPGDFEALIGQLLAKLGFNEVRVTGRSGDGGIDVRGTLVVGDVVRTRMAVQVKRWKQNVQSPIVQQVRGSLGAHEQGLIITTSDFSPGARTEASRADAVPVGLMDGEQLVRLLVENEIGVRRTRYDLIELGNGADTLDQD